MGAETIDTDSVRCPPGAHPATAERADRHAVLIGVNRYVDPLIPDLDFAAADAQGIYQILVDPKIGGFPRKNVTLLTDEDATEYAIETEIATKLPKRTTRDSLVFIFFAGHGAPAVDPRGHSKDGLEKYLVPHEAELKNLRATGVSMDAVQRFLGFIDSRHVLVFIDCCYSGVAGGRTFENPEFRMRASLSDEFLDDLAGEGRFVVTACEVNELALELPAERHGLFTHFLIQGLIGAADADQDGRVSVSELYEYVYEAVSKRARELGGSMHPVLKSRLRGSVHLTVGSAFAQDHDGMGNHMTPLDPSASSEVHERSKGAASRWERVVDILRNPTIRLALWVAVAVLAIAWALLLLQPTIARLLG